MQKPSILGIAAVAGIAAFCWTLYRGASKVQLQRPHSYTYTEDGMRPTGARSAGRLSTAASTVEELQAHVKANPEDFRGWARLAQRLTWAGKAEEAAEAYRRVIALAAAYLPAESNYDRYIFERAMAHRALDEAEATQAALAEYRKWLADRGEDLSTLNHRSRLHRFGWAARLSGDEETARLAWTRALEITIPDAENNLHMQYAVAAYQALLGHLDEALAALQQAADGGFADPIQAKNDEDLIALRDLPGFGEAIDVMERNLRRARAPRAQ